MYLPLNFFLPVGERSFFFLSTIYWRVIPMPVTFGSQRTHKIKVNGRSLSRINDMLGLGGHHERFTKGEVLWYMGSMFGCGLGLGAISLLLLMMATM